MFCRIAFLAVVIVSAAGILQAADSEKKPAEKKPPEVAAERDVSDLTKRALESVAVITFSGRDGEQEGLGTGFIASGDGLIATNLHVIGEARPITVKLHDGRSFPVQTIYASDAHLDLAVLKIDASDLPVLELGDSAKVEQGEPVIALGNPRGLRNSVVTGILSGKRTVENREMLQLAMPIEPGNSGGPLLDLEGRVLGLITLKSIVTDNLGFATPVDALKPLLESPNPIPMERWLTIGVLNPKDWRSLFGSNWRQRAGRIRVEGAGKGFGGRSLAVSTREVPELPYELEVSVKLDDESGAAGLLFDADGDDDDRHYGFYPSSGSVRLTRFAGPDVFSWHVVRQVRSDAYRPGEWNTLKVRVEADKLIGFVNGKQVVEESGLKVGRGGVGLCKFRDTRADFRGFRLGRELADTRPSPEAVAQFYKRITALDFDHPQKRDTVETFAKVDRAPGLLEQRARELEKQAKRLREFSQDVHRHKVLDELNGLLTQAEGELDLLKAALLIGRLDNPELEVEPYLQRVDQMADEIRESLPDDASDGDRLAAMDKYLFEQLGYHGSRHDYYNRSNSYLNEVIDDREGLPITLSVLYMELGRRLGLPIVGVGMPTHFIVRYEPEGGESQLIDPFHKGKRMTHAAAADFVLQNAGRPFDEQDLATVSHRQILERMLNNLFGIAQNRRDADGMRHYADALASIAPEEERYVWYRAVLNFQTGRNADALTDVDSLLDKDSLGLDRGPIQELRQAILRERD